LLIEVIDTQTLKFSDQTAANVLVPSYRTIAGPARFQPLGGTGEDELSCHGWLIGFLNP